MPRVNILSALFGNRQKALTINESSVAFSGAAGQISHIESLGFSGSGALRVAAVWIATTLIADEVSTLVWKIVEREDKARRPVRTDRLRPVWNRPNTYQTVKSFKNALALGLTMHGAAYASLDWRDGDLVAMHLQRPEECGLELLKDGSLRLQVAGKGELVNLPGATPEFMFIPLYQLPGTITPVSPVRYAAGLLGLSKDYDRAAERLMSRGINPSAVVTMETTIAPEQAEEISNHLEAHHGGGNAGGVAVIGGKDVKVTPWTMSMVDAEFIAGSDRVFELLMALWRVPPTVAGMVSKPSTWGTGIAEFSRGLERFTLRPIVERISDGYETYVLSEISPDLQYRAKFEALLSASPRERAEYQRSKLMMGASSIERTLAQDDEPPFEEDETVYSQLAMKTSQDRAIETLKSQMATVEALKLQGVSAATAFRLVGLDPQLITESPPPPEPPANE